MPLNLIFMICLGIAILDPASVFAGASDRNRVHIDLKPSVYVSSSAVYLGDVAKVSVVAESGAVGIVEKLRGLEIGSSPRPGAPVFLTRDKLAALIKQQGLVDMGDIGWGEESIVKINAHGELLKSEKIVSAARQYFEQILEAKYPDYQIEHVGVIKDKVVRPGAVRLSPKYDLSRNIAERNCVWVDVYVENQLQSTVHVWFKTKVFADALIATQPFRQYDYVQPEKLETRRVNVAGVAGDLFQKKNATRSFRFARSVKRNEVVTYENVEPVPLVEKGSLVKVNVQVGKVRIQNKAIAMSDGEMFEKITVQNRMNQNKYAVVITGDQEAVVSVK